MKNLYNILVLITILFTSNFVKSQDDILSKINEIGTLEQKVMMPMRDGIRLATDIYIPKSNQKVPIIFSRTPYNFNSWGDGEEKNRIHQRAYEALKRGYAYVVQNERGRYFSEGEWDILGIPLTDGYDAFSWMSEQSWS
ncbi:CocE/NonD family hydrolase, partial [Flavobacteriaceae bacterium]|nr:CocE/NonD family hydrolase [Flavobacteriaceae bacterium]